LKSTGVPFAQHEWIAEEGKAPPPDTPADYIAEGLDQTRGWFYTLHVLSVFLTGRPASKRILVGNLVLDAKKQKLVKDAMRKRKGKHTQGFQDGVIDTGMFDR